MSLPKYNLSLVFELRQKLADNLIIFIGTSLADVEYERFIEEVLKLLPPKINYSVLYESCSEIMNTYISKQLLYNLSWKLAGNIDSLKKGIIVKPWSYQTNQTEWVPAQVLASNKTRNLKNELVYNFKLRILAGTSCSMFVSKLWSIKECKYISSKIGFSAPWGNYPYRDASELINMRFLIEIEQKLCRTNEPNFKHIACTSGLSNWNKSLLKARAHLEPACPKNFIHHCYQCPIGYDQCLAGTHPRSYVVKFCSVCNKDTWHDPGFNEVCVTCRDTLK